MTPEDLDEMMAGLAALIRDRLGVRGRSFRATVARAGHLLPAPAREAAAFLLDLEVRLAQPKLAAHTDPALAHQAAATIRRHLTTRAPGQRAARARSILWAEIGFRVLVVVVLVLAVLAWRGFV